jgi:hypothetical protein
MNRIIFQLALLGFFLSLVVFGIKSMPLLEVLVNSFIVCISIILGGIAILAIVRFTGREVEKNNSQDAGEEHEPLRAPAVNQIKEKDSMTRSNSYSQKQKEKPLPA